MHACTLLHDKRHLDLLIFQSCTKFSILIPQVSPEDIDLRMSQQATGSGTMELVSGLTASADSK